MRAVRGNLWNIIGADAICIPTNGLVNSRGENIMGRGVAYDAKRLFPDLPKAIGDCILCAGVQVYCHSKFRHNGAILFSFPTKFDWRDKSNFDIIKKSAIELKTIANTSLYGFKTIILPQVGCGNGQLQWDDVKSVIEPILDDRFLVVIR